MKYFDTHAHYEDDTFLENQQEVLQNCREAGVTYIVNVGCNVASSQKSVALANSHSYIYAAIGIHPHDVGKDSVESLKRIYEDSNANKIVAIGEIGLDYAFVKENKKEQIELFEEQIMLANQFKLPVVIHARDAALDTYETIMRRKPEYGALFHCFQPSDDLVRLVLQEGYFVAFGGNIT
ncbi:MAG: TatD family hydrolase, partial [Longicatena sp.]